jgi:hypothetical protein
MRSGEVHATNRKHAKTDGFTVKWSRPATVFPGSQFARTACSEEKWHIFCRWLKLYAVQV